MAHTEARKTENRRRGSCRIEARLHQRVRIEAARRGVAMAALIETALREHLRDRNAQSVAAAT